MKYDCLLKVLEFGMIGMNASHKQWEQSSLVLNCVSTFINLNLFYS